MYITDDGIRLNATINMPAGNPEKCPLAIIIHGFTGHSEEPHLLAISDMLNGIGLATLRVDHEQSIIKGRASMATASVLIPV